MYVACGENHSWVEGRITRLPLLPCSSQSFVHFLTKLSGPFTWQTKSWLGSGIVNRLEWLWNPSDSFVICFSGPDGAQRSIAFLAFWSYLPIKTCHYLIRSQKTKDCAPSGSFQHRTATPLVIYLMFVVFHNQSPLITMAQVTLFRWYSL